MLKRKIVLFALLSLVLLVPASFAQYWERASFTPSEPTASDRIRVEFTVPGLCGAEPSTTVSGNIVRTMVRLGGCVVGPPAFPVTLTTFFGPVPAGTYTYEIYLDFQDEPPILRSRQPLVVASTLHAVPSLSSSATVIMLLLIAAVAVAKLSIGSAGP